MGEVDSFGVSEVELRDELLLESSLFCLLLPKGKSDVTNSETSLCSSLWISCFNLYTRSFAITCDKGIPKAWGMNSEKQTKPYVSKANNYSSQHFENGFNKSSANRFCEHLLTLVA